jgi:KDO2-lipid IV(A) lauroyltransferase
MLLYYLIVPWIYLLSYLPLSILYRFADVLSFVLSEILKYRRKVVEQNIRNSFPQKSEKEIKKIARESYTHLADRIVENIKCFTITKQEINKRVKVKNIEILHEWARLQKPAAVVLGHIGSWEFATYKACDILYGYYHCVGIVSFLTNKRFNNLIQRTRSKMGMRLIGMQYASEFYKEKMENLSAVFFIADQSPSNPQNAYWTSFLNQDTPFFLGAERYARLHNCGVMYVEIVQTKRGYYDIELYKICDSPTEMKENTITDRFTVLLENTLNKNPSDWLWSHKRWKHTRK